jgi:hypothetical protein
MFPRHLLAAARRLINMPHLRHYLIHLLRLSSCLHFSIILFKYEIEVTHRFINHLNVVEIRHIRHKLLLQVVLVKVLCFVGLATILHFENAFSEDIFKVTETLFIGNFKKIARDIAIFTCVTKEIHSLALLIDLEFAH